MQYAFDTQHGLQDTSGTWLPDAVQAGARICTSTKATRILHEACAPSRAPIPPPPSLPLPPLAEWCCCQIFIPPALLWEASCRHVSSMVEHNCIQHVHVHVALNLSD